MSCAKCHQAPPETGDTWCAACSAWEALASELAAPWHSRALRHLVTEQVEHLVRSVRALRNFSSSLKSAEASRAAERDRSERQAHSEEGERVPAAATAAKSKASRPEREQGKPEKAEEDRHSPARPRSPETELDETIRGCTGHKTTRISPFTGSVPPVIGTSITRWATALLRGGAEFSHEDHAAWEELTVLQGQVVEVLLSETGEDFPPDLWGGFLVIKVELGLEGDMIFYAKSLGCDDPESTRDYMTSAVKKQMKKWLDQLEDELTRPSKGLDITVPMPDGDMWEHVEALKSTAKAHPPAPPGRLEERISESKREVPSCPPEKSEEPGSPGYSPSPVEEREALHKRRQGALRAPPRRSVHETVEPLEIEDEEEKERERRKKKKKARAAEKPLALAIKDTSTGSLQAQLLNQAAKAAQEKAGRIRGEKEKARRKDPSTVLVKWLQQAAGGGKKKKKKKKGKRSQRSDPYQEGNSEGRKRRRKKDPGGPDSSPSSSNGSGQTSCSDLSSNEALEASSSSSEDLRMEPPLRKKARERPGSVLQLLVEHARAQLDQSSKVVIGKESGKDYTAKLALKVSQPEQWYSPGAGKGRGGRGKGSGWSEWPQETKGKSKKGGRGKGKGRGWWGQQSESHEPDPSKKKEKPGISSPQYRAALLTVGWDAWKGVLAAANLSAARGRNSVFPFREGELVTLVSRFKEFSLEHVSTPEVVEEWSACAWLYNVVSALNKLAGYKGTPYAGRWTLSKLAAVKSMRAAIERRCAKDAEQEPYSEADWQKELNGRLMGYNGEEISTCQQLTVEQVMPSLPPEEHGGSIETLHWVCPRTREFLLNPDLLLKCQADVKLPRLPGKIHVKAEDKTVIAHELVRRNICTWVPLDTVYKVGSQQILNGLFGVKKPTLLKSGEPVLRLIMNLTGSNATQHQLEGGASNLPAITSWQSLVLEQGQTLEMFQSDMSSTFYFFKVPPCWHRHLVFNIIVPEEELMGHGRRQFALWH
ncbi:unnamed protein product [Cladocopium goreaui]|uniref:Uncharacterized protein n=1 Tax=Cladocopium goreaui TaxID=2562237 RepID=A0A9P1CMX5_9DINO|nr:unnamed protein product [Cladocopium goreaui]